MKKLFVLVSLLMVFTLVPMAMADQLTVRQQNGYFSGWGGEFTLSGNDLVKFQPYYANSTKDIGNYDPSIQSFCVETNEYVSSGSTYNFKVSTAAIAGGTGGGSPDPISKGTAWLYYEFLIGKLPSYDYDPTKTRSSSAGALQDAIWYLEDESLGVNNSYVALAVTQFGTLANAKADNNGLYPVAILNLYNLDGSKAQDMLVAVPEPATMLLLGSGLIGLAGFARRRFRKN